MSFYLKFTGINELPASSRAMMRNYGIIRASNSAVFNLTGTIFILYIIAKIGFGSAALIMSIMMLTQLLIDYPSGTLGDYIGQRWVLTIAFLSAALGNYLMSVSSSFGSFVIIALIFGFSNAQGSGALQSWLDNNYKNADDQDPERKNYGYTMQRLGTIDTFIVGISILLGGFLATLFTRAFVFSLQASLILIIILVLLSLMRDETPIKVDDSDRSYLAILKDGIKYSVSNRKLTYFILGQSFMNTAWIVWGTLMLFPLYFGYSGSDSIAGMLRSTIFFIGVGIQILMANVTKRLEFKQLPKILLIHFAGLFISVAVLLYFNPFRNQLDIMGIVALMLILTIFVSCVAPLIGTLVQRITLDLVPSEYRNSIYSLTPTTSNILGFVLLPLLGTVVETAGFISALMLNLAIAGFGIVFIGLTVLNPSFNIKILISRITERPIIVK
ncbi:MAG: MFS transporter [Candidatus Heimdallarchaeota archaeon]|nr:MFS transporter [Candidatus Heimdallarchaeota archaeon]